MVIFVSVYQDLLIMLLKIMMLVKLYAVLDTLGLITIVQHVMIKIQIKMMDVLIIVLLYQDGYAQLHQERQVLHFVSKNLQ